MVRAAAWTAGLFGVGAWFSGMFPSAWTEPLVLVALGLAFLFVSARTGVRAVARRRPRNALAAKEVAA